MSAFVIREEDAADMSAIHAVVARAFGREDEAVLVGQLRADGDAVLSLVAEAGDRIVGHVLFSRLAVETDGGPFAAVALAPVAVDPDWQGQGVGSALIEDAHTRLMADGEALSVVLGDPAYYRRFGYDHSRAAGFECEWQGEALQALAWSEAPAAGRLIYAPAFSAL